MWALSLSQRHIFPWHHYVNYARSTQMSAGLETLLDYSDVIESFTHHYALKTTIMTSQQTLDPSTEEE